MVQNLQRRYENESEGEKDVIRVTRLGSDVASIVKGVGTRAREKEREKEREIEREKEREKAKERAKEIPRRASDGNLSQAEYSG